MVKKQKTKQIRHKKDFVNGWELNSTIAVLSLIDMEINNFKWYKSQKTYLLLLLLIFDHEKLVNQICVLWKEITNKAKSIFTQPSLRNNEQNEIKDKKKKSCLKQVYFVPKHFNCCKTEACLCMFNRIGDRNILIQVAYR